MAQKPVKKAAVKKAPVKKPVVKKAPVAKPAAKKAPAKKKVAAPVAQETVVLAAPVTPCGKDCGCGCNGGKKCGCGCGGMGRFLKKLVIFLVIFALGWCGAKFCMMKKFHRGFNGPRVEFVNGCLDVAKIPCPEMAAKISIADVNGDGCISKEEFKTVKNEMRKEFKDRRGEGCGCRKCGCGAERPTQE